MTWDYDNEFVVCSRPVTVEDIEARWRVLDEQQREIIERIGVWKARLSVLSRKLRDAKPEENKRRR